MGGSGKWFKSLFNPKKPAPQIFNTPQEKEVRRSSKGSRKWSLWRSSTDHSKRSGVSVNQERNVDDSEWSISSFKGAKAFSDSVAVSRGCMLIRQELAAVRIQTFFRRFLARQAFRALRAVVRIQSIFRGRQIRKQAAITLKCMQALVRVQTQARVRARSAWVPSEGRNIPVLLHENLKPVDPIKEVERRWCSSPASADEVRTKLQMRLRGALKRERALAYYLSQQLLDQKYNNERNRLQKEVYAAYPPDQTKIAKRREAYGYLANSPQHDIVTVRKNNITKRIGANPPQISPMSCFSCPGSEFLYDGFSHSATFLSAVASPSPMHMKCIEETKGGRSWMKKPSYMSPTQSIKAKQREGKYTITQDVPRDHRMYHRKSASLSLGDTSSTSASDPSPVSLCKDLYPPLQLDRYNRLRAASCVV